MKKGSAEQLYFQLVSFVRETKKIIFSVKPIFMILPFLIVCFVIDLFNAEFSIGNVKTMTRVDDFIISDFSKLSAFHGYSPTQVSLMAFENDKWRPIPFQIDQRKPDGTYAYTLGLEASKDPDPDIDANDELIFLIRNAGNQITNEKWPDGAKEVMELELSDPKNGNKGWLYLIGFSDNPPRSTKDYIRLEIDRDKRTRYVDSDEYRFGGASDRLVPDYMACKEVLAGVIGPDVLDKIKIRGKVRLPLGIKIPLKFEELLRGKEVGYIDGPIRVLVNIQGYIEILSGAFKFEMKEREVIYYYPNCLIAPIRMEVPQGIGKMIKLVELRGFMDFNTNIHGCSFFTGVHPADDRIVLDGKMNEIEKKLDTEKNIEWLSGYGPYGNITARIAFHPKPPNFGKRLYFLDDDMKNEPPEDTNGTSSVGFWLDNPDVGIGEASTVYIRFYTKKFFVPKDAPALLDILDHSVKVAAIVKKMP